MNETASFLLKRRRNKAKKMLRLEKPYLMGALLDVEVDRVLGIADSGKMDWVSLVESGRTPSDYPTPESVFPLIPDMAAKYQTRNYLVYWFFKKKLVSLVASGRTKADYSGVLEEAARTAAQSNLDTPARAIALALFSADIRGETLSIFKATLMLEEGLA